MLELAGYYDPIPHCISPSKVLVDPRWWDRTDWRIGERNAGITLIDLDRLVEHSFGCDFAAAVRQHGWKKWRETEYELLKRSIGHSAYCLGEGSLEDSGCVPWSCLRGMAGMAATIPSAAFRRSGIPTGSATHYSLSFQRCRISSV